MPKETVQLDQVIIRFAGDSGDGMQLTGDRFTAETATFGNDLSTLPDFPAEIRAPAGTLPGVSAFQLHFADHDIMTPGDAPNVLVAMNPAALKANLKDLPRGGDLIVNTDEFTSRNLSKVGYADNPIEDGSLESYNVHPIALTSLTVQSLKDFDLTKRGGAREEHVRPRPAVVALRAAHRWHLSAFCTRSLNVSRRSSANLAALQAGWNYGETTEDFSVRYEIKPPLAEGTYRNISGNLARVWPSGGGSTNQVAGISRHLPDHSSQRHPA